MMRNGHRIRTNHKGPGGRPNGGGDSRTNRAMPTAREFRLIPRSGEVIRVTRAASVQFAATPLLFRVIRVHDWSTYDGWAWLDGYELNAVGEAVDRRSIFVQVGGLQPANPAITSRFVGARRGSSGAIGGVVNQAAALRA